MSNLDLIGSQYFEEKVKSALGVFQTLLGSEFQEKFNELVVMSIKSLKSGGKLIFMGNGGSSMDGAHIAAEFTGRFQKERRGLPAISLADNVAAMTSIANDFSYEYVFSRLLESYADPKDLVIGLSTSGKSNNIVNAFHYLERKSIPSVLISGNSLEDLPFHTKLWLRIPSADTPRIQEFTLFLGHLLAENVENLLDA